MKIALSCPASLPATQFGGIMFLCLDIAKESAKLMQGGGGGRADVAQAGGKLADKLDEALGKVPDIIKSSIKE